jgi:hypothetical protein
MYYAGLMTDGDEIASLERLVQVGDRVRAHTKGYKYLYRQAIFFFYSSFSFCFKVPCEKLLHFRIYILKTVNEKMQLTLFYPFTSKRKNAFGQSDMPPGTPQASV